MTAVLLLLILAQGCEEHDHYYVAPPAEEPATFKVWEPDCQYGGWRDVHECASYEVDEAGRWYLLDSGGATNAEFGPFGAWCTQPRVERLRVASVATSLPATHVGFSKQVAR